jgi:hypothetical protein
MTDTAGREFTHSFVDRLLGRHQWKLMPSSFYFFRQGGIAKFEYECPCGALKAEIWPGEHEAGRRLTDEEKEALGPYL